MIENHDELHVSVTGNGDAVESDSSQSFVSAVTAAPSFPSASDDLIFLCLNKFPERVKDVIYLHFGLVGPRYTFEEIANKYSLSRQRVQQIESATASRLRHPSKWRIFKPFMSPIVDLIASKGDSVSDEEIIQALKGHCLIAKFKPIAVVELCAYITGAVIRDVATDRWMLNDNEYKPLKTIKRKRKRHAIKRQASPEQIVRATESKPLDQCTCLICGMVFNGKYEFGLHLYDAHFPQSRMGPFICPVDHKKYKYAFRWGLAIHWYNEHYLPRHNK